MTLAPNLSPQSESPLEPSIEAIIDARQDAIALVNAGLSGEQFGDIKVEAGVTGPDSYTVNFRADASRNHNLLAITHNHTTHEIGLLINLTDVGESSSDVTEELFSAMLTPATFESFAGERYWKSEDERGWKAKQPKSLEEWQKDMRIILAERGKPPVSALAPAYRVRDMFKKLSFLHKVAS